MGKITAWLSAGYLVLCAGAAFGQQSFSCSWGKEAACLDFGAKVCSQFGKCVDENTTCFKKSTCDFDGFMCVSDHNDYVTKAKAMARDYDDYVTKAKTMASNYDDLRTCISRASDMDAVQSCVQQDSYR
ncbi:MAG: hypothetical protein ACT6RN_10620 [Agrobacterium sp.]|uniref:hypothetical protein n=1 Tax=Agrobacterium sp. TaxID=361 RepID=UPI00403316B1